MLRRHHLLPQNQKTNNAAANCSIIKSLVQKHSIYKAISMKSLNLSYSTKNAAMSDLNISIFINSQQIASHRIKCLKLMAGAIKRYTQPTTTKQVVCTSGFGEGELFFCLNESPYIVISAGLRRDRCLNVKISEEDRQLIPKVDVE